MPQIEPGVDLEQVKAAAIVALEVDLRNAPEVQRGENAAPQLRDVRQLCDLDRRAQAVTRWEGSDLASREFRGERAAVVDVCVVAVDRALGPGHELLDQQIGAKVGQPRPDRN